MQIPDIDISQLPDPEVELALPILTTNAVTTFTATTAMLVGNISNSGTPPYAERGVIYATTTNPTIGG